MQTRWQHDMEIFVGWERMEKRREVMTPNAYTVTRHLSALCTDAPSAQPSMDPTLPTTLPQVGK